MEPNQGDHRRVQTIGLAEAQVEVRGLEQRGFFWGRVWAQWWIKFSSLDIHTGDARAGSCQAVGIWLNFNPSERLLKETKGVSIYKPMFSANRKQLGCWATQ